MRSKRSSGGIFAAKKNRCRCRNDIGFSKSPPTDKGCPMSIGVGRTGGAGSPSLRTGLAGLPHPALQLVGSTSRLAGAGKGFLHGVEPKLRKV